MRIYLNSQKGHLQRFNDSLKSLLKLPKARKNHSWCNFSPKWKPARGYSMKLILIYLFQNPLSSGDIKILLKATSDYLFIIHFAFFIQGICRITKQHITTEEFTHSFSFNTLLKQNKYIDFFRRHWETFIYRDIPIKNQKISVKANGSRTTLKTFPLVRYSDRNELLKSSSLSNKRI